MKLVVKEDFEDFFCVVSLASTFLDPQHWHMCYCLVFDKNKSFIKLGRICFRQKAPGFSNTSFTFPNSQAKKVEISVRVYMYT